MQTDSPLIFVQHLDTYKSCFLHEHLKAMRRIRLSFAAPTGTPTVRILWEFDAFSFLQFFNSFEVIRLAFQRDFRDFLRFRENVFETLVLGFYIYAAVLPPLTAPGAETVNFQVD